MSFLRFWRESLNTRDRCDGRTSLPRARRKALPALGELGVDSGRLAETATHMLRARDSLDQATADLARRAVTVDALGAAWLAHETWAAADPEIGLRLLRDLLAAVGGRPWPPRFASLDALEGALRDVGSFRGRTLSGCQILAPSKERPGEIPFIREATLVPPVPLGPSGYLLWDRRFEIRWPDLPDAAAAGDLYWAPFAETGGTGASALAMAPALYSENQGLIGCPLQMGASYQGPAVLKSWFREIAVSSRLERLFDTHLPRLTIL